MGQDGAGVEWSGMGWVGSEGCGGMGKEWKGWGEIDSDGKGWYVMRMCGPRRAHLVDEVLDGRVADEPEGWHHAIPERA